MREWTRDTYNPHAYRAEIVNRSVELWRRKREGSTRRLVQRGAKDVRLSGRDHLDPIKEATNQTGFRCVLPDLK